MRSGRLLKRHKVGETQPQPPRQAPANDQFGGVKVQENELPIGAWASPVLMTTVGAESGAWTVAMAPCATSATLAWPWPSPPWKIAEWLETKTFTLTWLDANAGVAIAPQATATRRSFFIAFLICDLVPAG